MNINVKLIARSLFKDKSYPVLNIIGLATGFACAFVALVWLKNEFSYDKNLPNADRIYRLTFEKIPQGTGSILPAAGKHGFHNYQGVFLRSRNWSGWNRLFIQQLKLVKINFTPTGFLPLIQIF